MERKKVIVFGTGDFSDIVSYVLDKVNHCEICGYTINENYISENKYQNKPLMPFEKIEKICPPEDYDIVLGFIGKKMFGQRMEIFFQIKEKGYKIPNVIHKSACVDTEKIGEGNIIMQNVSIEHHSIVGSGNIIWPNVVLPHHNVLGDFNNLAPSVSLSGYSKIQDHCFLGNNSCVNNHVCVQSYAYVGAGAYAAKDVPEQHVLVPNRSYYLKDKTGFDFL